MSRFFLPCLVNNSRIILLAVVLCGPGGFWLTGDVHGQNSAPSSHLVFDDRFDGDLLIHRVRVPKAGEAKYTYYETLGWRGTAAGYAGIQSHPRGRNFIFSIWDHPKHAKPIRAVHQGPGTEVQKFGGEGTGLKSWNFGLGWSTDTWYTLVARSWPVNDHTHYGFWVYQPEKEEWTHLVTMDVAVANSKFEGGTDAFIEDWLATGKKRREVHFSEGWKRKLDGTWYPFQSARYSVNSWDLKPGKRSFNYRDMWNGGVKASDGRSFYFMQSGGEETKPETTNPSVHRLARTDKKPELKPIKINSLKATRVADQLVISWELDPKSTPQFSFELLVTGQSTDKQSQQQKIIEMIKTIPHQRKATVVIPAKYRGQLLAVSLKCVDIVGEPSLPEKTKVTTN